MLTALATVGSDRSGSPDHIVGYAGSLLYGRTATATPIEALLDAGLPVLMDRDSVSRWRAQLAVRNHCMMFAAWDSPPGKQIV